MNILNKKSGYTLMEIMVTVMIIAILTAAGIPFYKDHMERQKAAAGITNLRMLADSVERYKAMRNDRLPAGYKLTLLDADLDRSKLTGNGTVYNDGIFQYRITNDTSVQAKRNTGEYTLHFSLGDTNDNLLSCTGSGSFCCDKLNISC